MKKDRIDGVLEMMEYIYKNHESEKCTEKALIEIFGEERCFDFERYAMGGSDPYAHPVTMTRNVYDIATGQDIIQEYDVIVLTQKGVRTVYALKNARSGRSIQEKLHLTQLHINTLLLGALLIIAVSTVWSFLKDVVQSREELTLLGLGLTMAVAIILVYIGVMSRNLHFDTQSA